MSNLKEEILHLGKDTLLTNEEIAKLLSCSARTVNKYAGSYIQRCKAKSNQDCDPLELQKAILLPDIHYPHYDRKVMESIEEFMIDYKPDEIVYMGDQMSLDCISGWNKRKPLLKEGQRLLKEYENFNEEILEVHEAITSDDVRRTFMIGNHEQRVEWYVQAYPELDGIVDIDRNLKLTERGYKVIPFNGVYKLGKLSVIHGFYWNKYHAAKTLEAFEGNVVYGHVHNPQMYAKVTPIDRKGYHTATALPCICNIKPDYKQSAPNFWINGFGIVEYLPATGFFNLYSIIIIEGCFMFNGKYYGKNL